MEYLTLLFLFSTLINPIWSQSYYNCNYYYYSSYNNALCCYKTSSSYYSYTYSYCPYYTSYTTSTSTTIPTAATSCSYYSYSSNGNLCCVSRDTPSYYSFYYYSYNNYYKYCPTTSTLDSICGSSCCYASVPVYANSDVFYYSTYHCPSSSYYYYDTIYTYCGGSCIMAIVFGVFGSCFCVCGLAFSIAFCALVHAMAKKKKKNNLQPAQIPNTTLPQGGTLPFATPAATPASGLQDSTMGMKKQFQQDTLPPQYPGYSYAPNPINTVNTNPYPHPFDTGVNIPPNPTYIQAPQVVTHGSAQPVSNVPAEENYISIQ